RDLCVVFFFPAEDGIRGKPVTGVQTCALPIYGLRSIASELSNWPVAIERSPSAPSRLGTVAASASAEVMPPAVGSVAPAKVCERSEERRVGKECRARGGADQLEEREAGDGRRS